MLLRGISDENRKANNNIEAENDEWYPRSKNQVSLNSSFYFEALFNYCPYKFTSSFVNLLIVLGVRVLFNLYFLEEAETL